MSIVNMSTPRKTSASPIRRGNDAPHGTKRHPTTPLSPTINRDNIIRRKLDPTKSLDPPLLEYSEVIKTTLKSPGKAACEISKDATGNEHIEQNRLTTTIERMKIRSQRAIWLEQKRLASLKETIQFLELERRVRLEIFNSNR